MALDLAYLYHSLNVRKRRLDLPYDSGRKLSQVQLRCQIGAKGEGVKKHRSAITNPVEGDLKSQPGQLS